MVEVRNINYLELSEDIKSEVERIIALTSTSLLQRMFVTAEYPVVGVRNESKPFFRELVDLMLDYKIKPGDEHVLYMLLHIDQGDEPVFQMRIHNNQDSPVAHSFVRFLDVGNLYQVHFTSNRTSLKETAASAIDLDTVVSKDFLIVAKAVLENNNVQFGIALD